MLHRSAKLTPFGRQLLVKRVVIEGWSAATTAEMLGVSRDRVGIGNPDSIMRRGRGTRG